MKIVTTTAAIVLATAIGASAMTSSTAVKNEVKLLGFDAAVVDALSDAQLAEIDRALHNGEDSDARSSVASLLLHFSR